MNIRHLISWAGAAAIALFVGMSSFVVANKLRNPVAALALGVPPSSAVSAHVAYASYAARHTADPKAEVTAIERAAAARAYRSEPLSTAALGVLVSSMNGAEQMRARQALVDLGGKLTRRSSIINSEQMRLAALRGDDRTFFRWLSRSVLTNDRLRNAYIAAMAQATARPGAVEALAPVVGQSPSWAPYYWRQVGDQEASLANAAKLRIAIAGHPWRQTGVTQGDEYLLMALTRNRQFDAAHELFETLSKGAPQRRGTELLANSDFARQPQMPPFDWLLARSGTLGSSIDDNAKSLQLSAIGGARGIAASQLVRLAPGRYTLNWSSSASDSEDPAALSARIYCAEPGRATNPQPVPLATGKHSAPVAIAEGACRWYWVSLYVALADESAGMDVRFQTVSLSRAAAGVPGGI